MFVLMEDIDPIFTPHFSFRYGVPTLPWNIALCTCTHEHLVGPDHFACIALEHIEVDESLASVAVLLDTNSLESKCCSRIEDNPGIVAGCSDVHGEPQGMRPGSASG